MSENGNNDRGRFPMETVWLLESMPYFLTTCLFCIHSTFNNNMCINHQYRNTLNYHNKRYPDGTLPIIMEAIKDSKCNKMNSIKVYTRYNEM